MRVWMNTYSAVDFPTIILTVRGGLHGLETELCNESGQNTGSLQLMFVRPSGESSSFCLKRKRTIVVHGVFQYLTAPSDWLRTFQVQCAARMYLAIIYVRSRDPKTTCGLMPICTEVSILRHLKCSMWHVVTYYGTFSATYPPKQDKRINICCK